MITQDDDGIPYWVQPRILIPLYGIKNEDYLPTNKKT